MKIVTHAELDQARHWGDEPADAVARHLGRGTWAVNAMLRHVHRNDDPLPDALPAPVLRFFTEDVRKPTWFDEKAAQRAAAWASRHLPQITVALFCASLPSAYAAARGARVLSATGRMRGRELDRRVNETAQFVLDVLAEDAFSPGGCGLRAVQKVRLVHAAVRNELVSRADSLDEVPINQEDMLGTLFTFSVIVVRSVRLLGVALDDDQAEDFYQLWRAIAVMLGGRESLVPADLASAEATCKRVAERQFKSSAHGQELFAVLLERMEQHVPQARFAPRYLVRYLAGDRVADTLGIERTDGLEDALAFLRFLPRRSLAPLAGLGRGLSSLVGAPLLQSVITAKLGGTPATYPCPERTVGAVEARSRAPRR